MADIINIKSESENATCETCIHVHEKSRLDGGGLECRFNPPQAFPIQTQQGFGIMSAFPPVQPVMSCGAYEADIDGETPLEKEH